MTRTTTERSWWKRLFGTMGPQPCDRCGVEGGYRYAQGERVGNRIVKRRVCSECSSTIFFKGILADDDREWCEL